MNFIIWKKHKEDYSKPFEPIVFLNNPITDSKNDAIGFETQIEILKKVIDSGANLIGIVADYGTGKSSMTELLLKKINEKTQSSKLNCKLLKKMRTFFNKHFRKKWNAPIRISLWDCLGKEKSDGDLTVSELTTSFLYQFANGYKKSFGRYVSKFLNKNYGSISLNIESTRKRITYLVIAVCFVAFYFTSQITGTGIRKEFYFIDDFWFSLIKVLGPFFVVVAAFFLYLAIKDSSVIYSYLNLSTPREPGLTDVYDVYNLIIEKVASNKKRKQIVFVDDMDRVEKPELCIDFLRELYRFQESMVDNKDKIVFIVSVGSTVEKESKEIFSKIFDYILRLKPIHLEDYDSLLVELFNNNPIEKAMFEKLVEKSIDKILSEDFYWIKQGDNLTLRDLKNRLNQALSIMVTLKNKNYKVQSNVSFSSCAAVTYLENVYPQDFILLISLESEFADFIRNSRRIVDDLDISKKEEKLNECFTKSFEKTKKGVIKNFKIEFKNDFCKMVIDELFNEDYRMYFYTYPKGTPIKTTDEKDLCRCILMPNTYVNGGKFESLVKRVFVNGQNDIISDTIKKMDEYTLPLIDNDILFRLSVKIDIDKTFSVFAKEVLDSEYAVSYKSQFLERVLCLDKKQYNQFLNMIIRKVYPISNLEKFKLNRLSIAIGFKNNVVDFKELFVNADAKIPLISAEEIKVVDNEEVSLELIDINKLSKNNFNYILDLVVVGKLEHNKKLFLKAIEIIKKYNDLISSDVLAPYVIKFLIINKHLDEVLFEIVVKSKTERENILKYISLFETTEFSDEYFKWIDELGFERGVSDQLLALLLVKGFFYTPLLHFANKNRFGMLNKFKCDNYESQLLKIFDEINKKHPELIVNIRKYFCIKRQYIFCDKLFFPPYPMITSKEYFSLRRNNKETLIDLTRVTPDDCMNLISFFERDYYSAKEIISLIGWFFDKEVNPNAISNLEIRNSIIDNINFKAMNLRKLDEIQREYLYKILKKDFDIRTSVEALKLLERLGCLIPSVEEFFVSKSDIQNDLYYCKIFTDFKELTHVTIKWLSKNYLRFGLTPKLSKILLDNGQKINYIIAESLREKVLKYDSRIPFDCYIEIYNNVDEMFEIMSNDTMFLQQLQDVAIFEKMDEKRIVPIFKIGQKARFFEYILGPDISPKIKEKYICGVQNLFSPKENRKFLDMISRDENISLVNTKEKFNNIFNCLYLFDDFGNMLNDRAQFSEKWKNKVGNSIDSELITK